MHNADLICILYRRQAVSDGDRCSTLLGTVQSVLNYLLVFTVQCTRCYTPSYAGHHHTHSSVTHLHRAGESWDSEATPEQWLERERHQYVFVPLSSLTDALLLSTRQLSAFDSTVGLVSLDSRHG